VLSAHKIYGSQSTSDEVSSVTPSGFWILNKWNVEIAMKKSSVAI
jgi:hypothetical protein